ncbi:MAG: hypothetical protein QOD50_163 [Actinomycetota bacterium]|nr:hypothetical protein [Actinomycetota bacterium]
MSRDIPVRRSGGGSGWSHVIAIAAAAVVVLVVVQVSSSSIMYGRRLPLIYSLPLIAFGVLAILALTGWIVGLAASHRLSVVGEQHPAGLLIDAVRSREFFLALQQSERAIRSRFNIVVAVDSEQIGFWNGERGEGPYLAVPWTSILSLTTQTAANEKAARGVLTFTAIAITANIDGTSVCLPVIPRRKGLAVFRPANPAFAQEIIRHMEDQRRSGVD